MCVCVCVQAVTEKEKKESGNSGEGGKVGFTSRIYSNFNEGNF